MFLDGCHRLAQPGPDLNRHSAQRAENFFFLPRLRLLFGKHRSGAAVPGVYPQDVLASEALNRALQDDRAVGSLTDLLRYLGGEALTVTGRNSSPRSEQFFSD